jgi:MYXO-CTERM domain-containing protein
MGALVDSAYLDLLSEYSTKGQSGGTNQTITRGTITKPYTITPISATGASIDDSQIAGELAAQVAASKLPAVTLDSTSNPNTLYVLFFPTGVTITEGGGASCTEFCGYHGSGTSGSSTYLYAVIPDLSQVQTYTLGDGGSVTEPCGYGCSYDAPAKPEVDWFNGTVSHEIGEAVTDPVNGSGWYDQSNTDFACAGSKSQNQPGGGEIGDVCVGYYDDEYTSGECEDTQKVAGTNINAQITWSNKLDGCYSGNPSVAPQCPPSGCYDGGPGPFDPGADAGSGSGSGSSSGGSSSGGGSGDASVSDDAGSGSGSGGGSGSGSGGGSGSGSGGGSGGSSGGESSSSGGGSGGGSGGASGGGVSPDAGSGNGDTGGSSNSAGGCNSASSPGGAGSPLAVGGALMALGAVLRRRKRGA